MRRLCFVFGSFLFALLTSCSTNTGEEFSQQLREERLVAVESFGEVFEQEVHSSVYIRGIEGVMSPEDMASEGMRISKSLGVSVDKLLRAFGVSDADLEAACQDYKDNLGDSIQLDELKCFTALALYSTLKENQVQTRAHLLDYVSCAGLGMTTKQLLDASGKVLAKQVVKKLAGRLVPYIGWGWAVASATYCISQLR